MKNVGVVLIFPGGPDSMAPLDVFDAEVIDAQLLLR